MPTINDGGPAFPHGDSGHYVSGLSLRDWFAGQCAAAALVNATGISEEIAGEVFPIVARLAYRMADAMLAARGQP